MAIFQTFSERKDEKLSETVTFHFTHVVLQPYEVTKHNLNLVPVSVCPRPYSHFSLHSRLDFFSQPPPHQARWTAVLPEGMFGLSPLAPALIIGCPTPHKRQRGWADQERGPERAVWLEWVASCSLYLANTQH